MLDRRGRLLLTALAFAGLRPEARGTATEIETLRRWLDSWPGIGAVVAGMAHQVYDIQITRYDAVWQHPWLRIQLLLRSMLGTRWDRETWPTIKAELKRGLEMKSWIQRAGWLN